MRLTFGKMTREMNIFKFDGQISDPEEQHVNMIDELQMDQGEDGNMEIEFEEVCKEEASREDDSGAAIPCYYKCPNRLSWLFNETHLWQHDGGDEHF